MIEELENRQVYFLVAGIVAIAVITFSAGFLLGGDLAGTSSNGNPASKEEIKQKVQSHMDNFAEEYKQQFVALAEQNENIPKGKISLKAEVGSLNSTELESLYSTTVTLNGTVPAERGGFEPLMTRSTYYVSEDGKYLFREPTELGQNSENSSQ